MCKYSRTYVAIGATTALDPTAQREPPEVLVQALGYY